MDWQTIDSDMTSWRTKVKDLQTNLGIGPSEGCFHCEYFEGCNGCKKSLSPELRNILVCGDWTYVGRQYGKALIGGKRAKVLFISMDRGGQGDPNNKVLEKFEETQRDFRKGAYKRGNAHMGGVDVELMYLLDKETSREDRCQQFALTNSVRCRPVTGEAASKVTNIMKQNCSSHTKAIIQELEPDIIIAQGDHPRESICRLFSPKIVKKYDNGRADLFRSVEIGQGRIRQGQEVLFLLTAHPANYPGFGYKTGYLPEELKRAFKKAKEIYSGV